MWKLRLTKDGTEHLHYALCIRYLQELLTISRLDGWDGFIFKVVEK